MHSAAPDPLCWVISDGRRGIENQALGLAEALARISPIRIQTKPITNTGAFKALPHKWQHAFKPKAGSYGLKPPFPDIAIGCGRQAIAPLRALKRVGVFTVYVQDPRMDPRHFDLVVAPAHDRIRANNVITITGSPNRITPEILEVEAEKFALHLEPFPAPRICVLIGGSSKTHTLDPQILAQHLLIFDNIRKAGYSLLLTTSRRTPEFAQSAYAAFAKRDPHVWLWDATGDNPYFAFLAAAQTILVSEDSTNMLTEACATGKSVYRLPMGGQPGKFAHLYKALEASYGVKPVSPADILSGLDTQTRTPLVETSRAAGLIWQAMQKRV